MYVDCPEQQPPASSKQCLPVRCLQVQYWAPQGAGAGVTLVMAYLNGNHVPNLLRARTLITKLVGTICSVSAGFPMGPEGPMVHIGACLASVITYAQCSEWPYHRPHVSAHSWHDGRWVVCCLNVCCNIDTHFGILARLPEIVSADL